LRAKIQQKRIRSNGLAHIVADFWEKRVLAGFPRGKTTFFQWKCKKNRNYLHFE
jgi:hypothetical protein